VETEWTARGFGGRLETVKKHVLSGTPLGALTQPEDVAAVILSLIGGAPQVTGQTIVVDGGYCQRG